MAGTGISGLSVGIITVGGLFVYAGIRGVTPLQALRDVSSGQPTAVTNAPGVIRVQVTADGTTESAVGSISDTGSTLVGVSGRALSAVTAYKNDRYSKPRRSEKGYSDCSSFVCKAFHAVGVSKPDGRMTWPNTSAFAIGPAWKTIKQSQARPGDIAVVSGHHMVFVTNSGGTQGIGQQNPSSNVKTGTIGTLFANVPGKPIFRTYVGTK